MNTPEWVRNAKVGDKVVCVKTPTKSGGSGLISPLMEGKIYEIKGIKPVDWLPCGVAFDVGFVLNGFKMATNATNFKPLEKRKTDISVFTKMLLSKDKEIA